MPNPLSSNALKSKRTYILKKNIQKNPEEKPVKRFRENEKASEMVYTQIFSDFEGGQTIIML